MSEIRFEKLTRGHNRKKFDCGEQSLNRFIKKFARQNAKKNLGQTYVLTDRSKDILGFYTLSSAGLDYDAFPKNQSLPKYAIPSALIGRLAVDNTQRGKGYGKLLLIDALKRILKVSEEMGIHCITVDAKDAGAKKFYEHFGIEQLLDEENHLFISIEKVKNSIP